jgi:hypothetical protein
MKKCLEIFYFQFIVGADGDWIRIHEVEKKKKEKKYMIHGIKCGLDMTRRIGCFIYLFIFTFCKCFYPENWFLSAGYLSI